jgi:hypothetical protein
MTRDQIVSAGEWGVIVAVVILDAILARATGIGVDTGKKVLLIAIIAGIWPVTALISRLTGLAKDGVFLTEIPGKFFSYVFAASVLEYYLATTPAPLYDDLLIRADAALGVDWPSLCRWYDAHPTIHALSVQAYFAMFAETALVVLLSVIFFPRRARRFCTALIISSLCIIPVLALFPAAGPVIVYQDAGLPQSCFASAYGGQEHYMMMRTGMLASISLDDLRGIVDFPSYHACVAVLLCYFLRGIPVVFPLSILLNLAMISATPLVGGHYVVDVPAGLAVAAVTIYCLNRIERGHSQERVALWRQPGEAAPKEA